MKWKARKLMNTDSFFDFWDKSDPYLNPSWKINFSKFSRWKIQNLMLGLVRSWIKQTSIYWLIILKFTSTSIFK
jgi:hypothetical protein